MTKLTLDLSPMAILTFGSGLGVLLIYTVFDIRTRRIPNEIIVLCSVIGAFLGILSGSLVENWVLHASAVLSFGILGYVLFRLGSVGGGDAKAGISVGLVSPGLALASWAAPIFEGVLVSCLELCIMLVLGYSYFRLKNREGITPLVPGLLIGYVLVQLLAVF